jgi:serine/threonine-protein kinase RsbW
MAEPKRNPQDAATVELRHERSEIDRVVQEVVSAASRHGYPEAAKFALRLGIEEAVSNAFNHGNRGLPAETPVTVSYEVGEREIRLSVRDRGPGFDPGSVPDPTEEGNIEIPSGRGLLLMRAYMAEVDYVPPGNEVRMVYRRPGA